MPAIMPRLILKASAWTQQGSQRTPRIVFFFLLSGSLLSTLPSSFLPAELVENQALTEDREKGYRYVNSGEWATSVFWEVELIYPPGAEALAVTAQTSTTHKQVRNLGKGS